MSDRKGKDAAKEKPEEIIITPEFHRADDSDDSVSCAPAPEKEIEVIDLTDLPDDLPTIIERYKKMAEDLIKDVSYSTKQCIVAFITKHCS